MFFTSRSSSSSSSEHLHFQICCIFCHIEVTLLWCPHNKQLEKIILSYNTEDALYPMMIIIINFLADFFSFAISYFPICQSEHASVFLSEKKKVYRVHVCISTSENDNHVIKISTIFWLIFLFTSSASEGSLKEAISCKAHC